VRSLAIFVALAGACPAFAQTGPSLDCGKASTAIEKTICADNKLVASDHQIASDYGALLARLNGSAKEHLVTDQQRWIGYRDNCARGDDDLAACLADRFEDRLDFLKPLGDGGYPFVSEHEIEKSGKVKHVTYKIDVRYPQFDGPDADFRAVNKHLADEATRAATESTPDANVDSDREQEWSYDQKFRIYRPSGHAVAFVLTYFTFAGGAHPNGGREAGLVDLRTGKLVRPDGVFASDDAWSKQLMRIVGADLARQFKERPGFDDALEPAKLAELLKEPGRYLFKKNELVLIFNRYEVGPYVNGEYEVEIPYARLKPLLRPDGPI
jgi:uncharacterized protein